MNEKIGEGHIASKLDRARNAKGHRPACACTICRRIQSAIEADKPPKDVTRAMAHQRRLARARKPTPRNRREQRIAKDATFAGAVVAQAAAGQPPNIAEAARIAGIDASQAHRKLKADESIKSSIHAALDRAGITDDKLAAVAAEGLQSYGTRHLVIDGEVQEHRYKDFHGVHKYWRDLMMAKGHLARDDDDGAGFGGLMIINGPVQINTGHKQGCKCNECELAFQAAAEKILMSQRRREAQMNIQDLPIIDGDVVEAPRTESPRAEAAPERGMDDDWDEWG